MISQQEYITMSLDLNLFFLRIMKEHSFFLQLGFMPKDSQWADEAENLKMNFEKLLSETVQLADGHVSRQAIDSKQFITEYTLDAERLTNFYTGVPLDINITRQESGLSAGMMEQNPRLEQQVDALNRNAFYLTSSLADLKERLLASVRSCRMFTVNYPLLIEHILREARFFMNMLVNLIERKQTSGDLLNQEIFWNQIMAEHSKFIAGLLDPSEEALIDSARMFGKQFDVLTAEAKKASRQTMDISKVTNDSIAATSKLRDFKSAGAKGILECKIESIIIPLLSDHVLREANHYLCVLGRC